MCIIKTCKFLFKLKAIEIYIIRTHTLILPPCPYTDEVEALAGSHFGSTLGPIFLDQLHCSGDEPSLLECPRFADLGLYSMACDHSQEAGVRCPGGLTVTYRISHFFNNDILLVLQKAQTLHIIKYE